MQADSIIPNPGSPLAWDRFAYSGNNPINYNDPSGHRPVEDEELEEDKPQKGLCDYAPKLCEGGRWNPINYDSIGIAAEIDLKMVGGGEIIPTVFFDWKNIRDFNFAEGGGIGLFITTDFSAGASIEATTGGAVIGADGKAIEQLGVNVNGNASGCLSSICFGMGAGYDPLDRTVDSIEYFGGTGQGVDVSGGVSYTDFIVYYDAKAQVLAVRLPVPITGIGSIPPVIVIPFK